MITEFSSKVRFSECAADRKLSVKAIVDYLQDVSTIQTEDIGVGIDFLDSKDLAWLMASWQVEIVRRPELGEDIIASTWPHQTKGFFAYRCHALETPDGELLAKANSIWFMMNQKSLRPVKIEEDINRKYETEERLDMPFAPRKIRLSGEYEEFESIRVQPHQIDKNHHMNNGHYVDLAVDYLPDGYEFDSFRVEYINGARLGDIIIPRLYTREDGITAALCSDEGKVFASIEFKKTMI